MANDVQAAIAELDEAKLALAGGTMTGALQFGDQELRRPLMLDDTLKINVIGNTGAAVTFDLENGNIQSATVDQNITVTLSNPLANQHAQIVLYLTNGGAFTVTWPALINWDGGTAPELQAASLDIIALQTLDGGIAWYGFTVWGAA